MVTTMMHELDVFMPATWFESGLLKDVVHNPYHATARMTRKGLWSAVRGASIAMTASLAFSSSASAVMIHHGESVIADISLTQTLKVLTPAEFEAMTVKKAEHIPKVELLDAPGFDLRIVRKTFNNFFDGIRAGKSMIPNQEMFALASKAVATRNETVDIEAWSERLVEDIKYAKD